MKVDWYFSSPLTGKRVGYADTRVDITKGIGGDGTVAVGEGVGVRMDVLGGRAWGEVCVGNGTVRRGA